MNNSIAGYKETLLQLDTLEALQAFMKENHIEEQSETCKILSDFQSNVVSVLLDDNRIQAVSK